MSDDRDRDGERGGRDEATDRPGRGERDGPLGDLAAEVRERTGERPAAERPDAPQREGPLADVASKVDERRRKTGDGADAFESVDVGELDGEKLWEQLAEGGDEPPISVAPEATDGATESATEPADDRDVRTIPKETCHGCPHFGDPPELACTHEGTSILAMPDTDHFRVADCPIVVEGEEDIGGIGVESDESAGDAE
jgi:hypothetical protein